MDDENNCRQRNVGETISTLLMNRKKKKKHPLSPIYIGEGIWAIASSPPPTPLTTTIQPLVLDHVLIHRRRCDDNRPRPLALRPSPRVRNTSTSNKDSNHQTGSTRRHMVWRSQMSRTETKALDTSLAGHSLLPTLGIWRKMFNRNDATFNVCWKVCAIGSTRTERF